MTKKSGKWSNMHTKKKEALVKTGGGIGDEFEYHKEEQKRKIELKKRNRNNQTHDKQGEHQTNEAAGALEVRNGQCVSCWR